MKPHGTYDTAFQAGAASRDAEVESLRQQLDFRNREILFVRNQPADSQKQVTLLREWAVEAVEFVGNMKWSPSLESQGRRVIAATEPKS